MGDRILLAGGSGLVGRNLLENDDFSSYEILHPRRSELDLTDRGALDAYIRRHRPFLVIHAAGKVGGIAANTRDQAGFLEANTIMGINLALAAAENQVPRFLNLSSSCVYPREARSPLRPDMLFSGPLEPTNEGYALAKLTVLRFGEFLQRQTPGFEWRSLIPCNLYGRWDHFSPERSHLVAAIIRKLHHAKVEKSPTVEIWGNGEVRREFMLAADLARVVVAVIKDFESVPTRLNVGVGIDRTVNDYYQVAAKVIGWRGQFVHNLDMPSGMPRKLVDTVVPAGMSWPSITPLEEGIRTSYDFFLRHVAND